MTSEETTPAEPTPAPAVEPQAPAQGAPEAGPAQEPARAAEQAETAEEEPAALTAREEFLIPLYDLGRHIRTGSPVLVRLIIVGLWQALRKASGGSGAAEGAAPAPAKTATVDMTKDAAAAEGETPAPAEAAKPTSKGKAKAAAGASFFEQLGIGALIVACCVGALGSLGPLALYLLAPYRWWALLAVVVGWCLTAAAVAPKDEDEEDPNGNDHETGAGETPVDPAAAAQEWERQKAAIWTFAEQATAAGAAGHYPLKGKGVSVDYLLDLLQERQPLPGWGRKEMIDFLDLVDIPMRDQISFRLNAEKKTPPGVHLDDMAKALGRRPLLDPRLVPNITPGVEAESDPVSTPATVAIPGPRLAPEPDLHKAVMRSFFGPPTDPPSGPPAAPQPEAPPHPRTGAPTGPTSRAPSEGHPGAA